MQTVQLTRIFKALSSPHRLTIYLRLRDCCANGSACSPDASDRENCVGEIAAGLNLAPSTVSHHLRELRQAGLISMVKSGQKQLCSVDLEILDEVKQFFHSVDSHKGAIG